MLSATLDTSCCLDLHRGDASPDAQLVTLLRYGLSNRLDIRISEVAEQEIAASPHPQMRTLGLARLRMFPVLELPKQRQAEADQLTAALLEKLFPKTKRGSRTAEHNERDCRHLAIHKHMGRSAFVTLDAELRKRGGIALRDFGIRIVTPSELANEVTATAPVVEKIEATVAARAYQPSDEADVRRVLSALAKDYPGFDAWLTKTLVDPETTVVVGLIEDRVAGAVIWKARGSDHRAVKLSAFRIDEAARNSGLGGHMLFHALRQWVTAGYEVAYVTVSSRHGDLISFFATAGFLIQGLSPLRYDNDATEIVMGKLLLRIILTPENIDSLAERLRKLVFGRPGPRGDSTPANDELWFLPPRANFPLSQSDPNSGEIHLIDEHGGGTVRTLRAYDLETTFYPLRIVVPGRRSLIVPIRPDWADRMLTYVGKQEVLFGRTSDPLLIRGDNAYYCFPRCSHEVGQRCRILFYVSAPISAVVGEAIVTHAMVDYPEVLHRLFGDLGIYSLSQIQGHVSTRGQSAGMALALRFAFYVPFPRPVPLSQLRRIVGAARFTPQGLHPIVSDIYEALRSSGGLTW